MLSRQIAQKLRGYETPFYLYDTALLRQTLESVVYESKKYGYKVHYAIKANYDDHLLAIIREYGLGIDCASGNELRKAVEAGFDPKGIVYAGVGKRDKELRYAIGQEIMAINCESIEELELVDRLAGEAGKKTDVALRINPDIDPKTNHCIDTGQADSKFGISYEEVLEHAKEIKSLKNIRIVGIHLHIGSQIRELHVFENMCNKVNVIVENLEKLGFSFRFVDVGGGFAQAFHRVGGVHLIGLAVAVMRGGLRRVAERAVERGGVLHRIGHDRRIHIPRLVQRFADSQNAAVHHVGRRHHVRTGLDMAEGGLGKQFQRGIVHHFAAGVAFLQDAAMTVRSVFAQTHVGHNLQIRPLRLKHTDGALHDAVRGIGFAGDGVLVLGDAEQHERTQPRVHGFAHGLLKLLERKLVLARHGRDFLLEILIRGIHHKIQHHKVSGGQLRLTHHFTDHGIAAQTAPTIKFIHNTLSFL